MEYIITHKKRFKILVGVWIHQGVKGVQKVEEPQHQEEVEGVVVEDREGSGLSVSNFILLPRYPASRQVDKIHTLHNLVNS